MSLIAPVDGWDGSRLHRLIERRLTDRSWWGCIVLQVLDVLDHDGPGDNVGQVYLMVLELSYDSLGNRLRTVGPEGIDYDRLGNRPKRFGSAELHYDRLGNRLRRIGSTPIDYDRLGARAKRLGGHELEYDLLGSRLRAVGPVPIEYDRLGNRMSRIGAFDVEYDMMGTRPRRLDSRDRVVDLDDDVLMILCYVLAVAWPHWRDRDDD